MADPLSVLRQCYLNKKQIVEQGDQIIFGELSWLKKVKTNYLIYGTGKNESPKEYYTLECVLYFLKNVQLKHSAYVRQAAAEDIPVVRRPDRKELLSYLNGEIRTSSACDKSAYVEKPIQVKRIANDNLQNDIAKKPRIEETNVEVAKKLFAARLEAPKEVAVTVQNIKSLSEVMTVDKIAAIKTKRLVKKRTTIKQNDDIEMESAVQAVFDMDIDDTNDIISRERNYRTRKTILQSNKKEFAGSIFAILNSVKAKEENRLREPVSARPTPSMVTPHSVPSKAGPQVGSYNRYDQERFNKISTTGEFNINTTGTYHGISLENVKDGQNPSFRKHVPVNVPANVPVHSGNLSARPGLVPVSAAKFTPEQAARNKRPSRTPIIIVPPSLNVSLITMQNATEILQDFKYVSNLDRHTPIRKRETETLIQRRKEQGTVPYRIVNNPLKLTKEEWERVVAVFVLGPLWQFKGWPYNGNPVDIFSKICGFHMKFDEMRLDSNIARWSVDIIELSKTKRHLDRASIMQFWEIVDKHVLLTKPHLRF